MVNNDNVVVSLFIFLAILAVFLVVVFFSVFDVSRLLTAAAFNPNVTSEVSLDPLTEVDVESYEPEGEEVQSGIDRVPYPVLDINQPDHSLFAPRVGASQQITKSERTSPCTSGFMSPSATAYCMYQAGLITYPLEHLN